MEPSCSHLEAVRSRRRPVHPSGHGCAECLARGSRWVHLRLCMECGHVGCCDNSPHRDATRHFHETGHAVIKSFEPGEAWAWCYPDELMLDGIDAFPEEAAPVHYAAPIP